MAKQCVDCGSSLSDDATSCDQCGAAAPSGEPAPPPPPRPEQPAQPSQEDWTVDGPTASGGSRVSTARPTTGLNAGRATTFQLSQLPLLNSKKRIIVAGVLVVMLVAVVVGAHTLVQRTVYTPEQAVTGFFQSLQERDAQAAHSYLNDNGRTTLFWIAPSATLATEQVLRSKEYKPPTNVKIVGTSEDGDSRVVRVSYDVTGENFVSELRLSLDEERDGLFRRWQIDKYHAGGVLGEIYVKANYPEITVNGMRVSSKENLGSRDDVPEPSVRMSAFPGGYQASVPQNPLLEAEPQYVGTVATDEYVSVEVPLTLRESAKEEIRRQVDQRIDNCVKDDDLVPKDGELYCPFRSLGSVGGPDTNQRDIEWSVKKYPKVRIFHEPTFLASGVQVRGNEWGDEAGVVQLSYTADDPFETKPKKVTTEVMFGIDGTAEVVQGKARFVDG